MKKLFTLIAATLMAVCVNAKETTLIEGDFTVTGWANQPTFLSDTGTELKSAGALPGDVVRFYIDSADEGWQVQIVEGHWGPTYAIYAATALTDEKTGEPINNNVVDLSVTPYMELELTEEILEAAYKQQYWGGVFLLNGDGNVKISKMTLKTALDWSEEAKNITFNEEGFIAASEFEGLDDKAIVKFTYNVSGDITSYTNWGIGKICSNDGTDSSDPTVTIANLPASALGDLTVSCFFEDIKKALVASPDGIMFGVWDFGEGTAVASRVKVEAFDVIPSGIQQTIAPAKVIENNVIYNLAGQKVNESYKGIVIKNGKKFIQK